MKLKKKHWIFIIIGLLVVSGVVYGLVGNKPKVEYTTATVTRGTLQQSVRETGTITPAKEIELNFNQSGQLTKLNVKVGDQVKIDQLLGEIDSANLTIKEQEAAASVAVARANILQAQTSYDSAKREYDKSFASLSETLKQAEKTLSDLQDSGSSTITTQEQAITTAESALATTKATYQRGIDNKFASLEVTIDSKLANAASALDAVNRVLTDEDLGHTLSIKNSALLTQLRTAYPASRDLTNQANDKLAIEKAARTETNLSAAHSAAQTALNSVFQTLALTASVLENTIASSYLTQTELDAFKTNITGQQTTISTAITSLQSAQQALNDAHLSYDTNVLTAEQSLNQAKVSYANALLAAANTVATARTNRDQQLNTAQTKIDNALVSVTVARAQASQASANLALIKNQIADNSLKSPIAGIITKINYEIGEQVTAQQALMSVLTENNYQIEVDVAETDISKVKLNDNVEITLDALGPEQKFFGKVYFVEPAATIIQGVTYYKIKISFDPGDVLSVKPGMTASAIIMTAQRDNVLIMPARAVVETDGKTIVRILENDKVREAPVTVGLSGDDGLVEILSGVNEGDQVVTFIKNGSK